MGSFCLINESILDAFEFFLGQGVHTDTQVSYHLKLNNDALEYSADVGATMHPDAQNKHKTTYKPFLKIKTPGDGRDSSSFDKVRMTNKPQSQIFTVDGKYLPISDFNQ